MDTNKINDVLRRLEEMEGTWRIELTDEEDRAHSFGRVPEDGKEIRFWSIPPTTGKLLECWIVIEKATTILELGCSSGYSTLYLARAAITTGGHVYTTEILPAKISIANKSFSDADVTQIVTLFEQDIADVIQNWSPERKIDFVFMDADKERYLSYYEKIIPLLREGGMIVCDNAVNYSYLMEDFLERVKTDNRIVSYLLELDNGLMVIRKKRL